MHIRKKKKCLFYYVYIITNTVLNKQYVGSKMCYMNTPQTDGYMGTSKFLDADIQIYGIQKFKKDVIKDDYKSIVEMLNGETENILKYNTLSPNGYNIVLPTQHLKFHFGGHKHSNTTKTQIGKSSTGRSYKPYIVIDPNNIIYNNVCLIKICRENNLNFDTMRKHTNYGKIKLNKTHNIKSTTLNCENWEVIRNDKTDKRKILWTLINPKKEIFNFHQYELQPFLKTNNLNCRILNIWKNKGVIKMKNKKLCSENTLNTEGWEFKNYTKWGK